MKPGVKSQISRRSMLKGVAATTAASVMSRRALAQKKGIRVLVVADPFYYALNGVAGQFREETGIEVSLESRGIDCWDAVQALVGFEGKAFGTFETSWIVPNSYTNVVDNRLTLYGERGGLELKNEPSLSVFTDRFHTPFSSESVTRYGKAWGYQYESIRYFIDCVADNIMPEAAGRDGLMVTAMIEATVKSLTEKRPVKLAEVLNGTDP